MTATAIFLLFCILAFPQPVENWTAPWFCHDYECPEYTVTNTYETFEERVYNASRWLMTEIEGTYYKAAYDGFMRLYSYTDGENEAGEELEMTRPIAVRVVESDSGEGKKVSMSLYIPPNAEHPKPTDASIKEVSVPAGTVYVRSFGGIASESDWQENIKVLQNDLQSEGKHYNALKYVAAGYDPPWNLINRHNEVWIPAV